MRKADFLQLFEDYHAPLFRFAWRMTGSVADAEDVVQTCFLELLKPDCTFDPKRAPIRAWLFGAVRNQALKRQRRGEPEAEDHLIAGLEPSPESCAARTEIEDAVRRAITQLPEIQREVLILAHYEQMPLGEIAQALAIELGAVKSRLQRARASLKETLAAWAPGMERRR